MKTKQIMPFLVLFIAMGFHSVDIFTEFEIDDQHLIAIDVFLAPFGLGGLLKSGYKLHQDSKTKAGEISTEDITKLEEILKKAKS